MKLKEILFEKPVHVLQVFRYIRMFGKEERENDRKDEIPERTTLLSNTGYVHEGCLYLKEAIHNDPNFKTCDLITLEDEIPEGSETENSGANSGEVPANYCLRVTSPANLHIFSIRQQAQLELHLQYSHFGVGVPARENFKLCDLLPGKPVEIRINGKIDFSMASRRARMYKEQRYSIEYLGAFHECRLLREPWAPVEKQVPEANKQIDLTKMLW